METQYLYCQGSWWGWAAIKQVSSTNRDKSHTQTVMIPSLGCCSSFQSVHEGKTRFPSSVWVDETGLWTLNVFIYIYIWYMFLTLVCMRSCCDYLQCDISVSLLSLWIWRLPADLNVSLAVCVCVVSCESVCLCHWEAFMNISGCVPCNKVVRSPAPWGTRGIRAGCDFTETSDNGRLVCVVLNRRGEWMTTASASGVSQELSWRGHSGFIKYPELEWGQVRNLTC